MAQSPYLPPGMTADAIVVNPVTAQNNDSNPIVLGAGRQGEQLTSTIRGQYGAYAHRSGVFGAALTTAAGAIAINTTTSAATWTLVNPAGSGVYVEFLRCSLGILAAGPASVNMVGLSIVNNGTNAISGITKAPDPVTTGGHAVNLSGVAPQAYTATVITYASALTVAANWERCLFTFPATWLLTAATTPAPLIYDFNGSLLIPPGWSVSLTASTAWAANTVQPNWFWAEYKI